MRTGIKTIGSKVSLFHPTTRIRMAKVENGFLKNLLLHEKTLKSGESYCDPIALIRVAKGNNGL